jgi:hypothetical protein
MIMTRPELAFPVVKLSQFSVSPAVIHYNAILSIFRYLAHTRSRGITYTRQPHVQPLPWLNPLPCLASLADHVNDHLSHLALYYILHGYSKSDWAMDIRHRRSITGLLMLLAGGSIAWKCRVQTTISLSTTEAEFLSATDAGRLALYLHSLMADIDQQQDAASPIFDDNRGSVLMSQASQPTHQTCHIDIRKFALLDWCERDLIKLVSIPTTENPSDLLTKQCPCILFARHYDNLFWENFLLSFISYFVLKFSASIFFGPGSVGGDSVRLSDVRMFLVRSSES